MNNGREKVETPFCSFIILSVTMETSCWIWPNFKLIQALMYVIITCKYEKDLIKNNREKWRHRFSEYKSMEIFRSARAANSAVGGPIRPKFELVRALMHVIVICKYENEPMKNSREKVETPFCSFITLSVTLETSGWIWPNFKLIQAMLSLPASMKRIRSRTAEKKWRHPFTHDKPMRIFSGAQGQLTPQWVVQSGRNSNSSQSFW